LGALITPLVLAACSGDDSTGQPASGGAIGRGGANPSFGGAIGNTGGFSATGGRTALGGSTSSSGGVLTGGLPGQGGASSGGASKGGSSNASGGSGGQSGSASGGNSQGGANTAGSQDSGGISGTGGAAGSGGSTSSGGKAGAGGTPSGGVNNASGGKGGAGGTSSSGGAGGKASGGASSGGSSTGGSSGDTCKAPDFGMYGYAKASGVTGGKGGNTVRVSSLSALQSAASGSGAAIIVVTGRISGSGIVEVASNKTIVGEGSVGELAGIELALTDSSNIIIRNLKIHHVLASTEDGDAIHLQDTSKVWIDHCELYADSPAVNDDKDKFDGLIDLTHGTSNVTVSWSYIHDHWKGLLIGSSDDDSGDRRLTFHHNHIKNINSRLPSYRFGTGHVYNNYYEDVATSGVNTRMNACLRVERNHFVSVQKPISTLDSDTAGKAEAIDNLFESSTMATGSELPGACTWSAAYTYTPDPVSCVKALVTANAGVGKIDPLQGLP
jgi:pectate lyase